MDVGGTFGDRKYNNPSAEDIAALHDAVHKCDFYKVKRLLSQHPHYNLNKEERHGETILFRAVFSGDVSIGKLLIEAGADVNVQSSHHSGTALTNAISKRHIDFAKMLLNYGADPSFRNCCGCSVLLLAVDVGDLELLDLLVRNGADIHEKDAMGLGFLDYASFSDKEGLKEFFDKVTNEKSNKDLLKLVYQGNLQKVREFFDENFWTQKKEKISWECLKVALIKKNKPMMRLLITWGGAPTEEALNDLSKSDVKLLRQYGVVISKPISFFKDTSNLSLPEIEGEKIPQIQTLKEKPLNEKVVNLESEYDIVMKLESKEDITFNKGIDNILPSIPEEWTNVLASFQKNGAPEAVIAGGALRDTFNDRPIKDVDIFLKTKGNRSKEVGFMRDAFKMAGVNVKEHDVRQATGYGSINVFGSSEKIMVKRGSYFIEELRMDAYRLTSSKTNTEYNIIFMNENLTKSWAEDFSSGLINSFDLGFCQIATDGKETFYTNGYKKDVTNKSITLKTFNDSSKKHLKRLLKKYPDWELCNEGKKLFPLKNKMFSKFKIKK